MLRIFIENTELELDSSVQVAITKQFEDLSNPATVINDWSKTVSIPFTAKNNATFGHIYCADKLTLSRSGGNGPLTGIYFDPYKKLNMRLQWGDAVVMTGYAKMNEIKQVAGKGTYELTLFGQLGKVFQEMMKITFDESSSDTDYIIDGSLYVDENMNKELVYKSWTSSGQEHETLYPRYFYPSGSSTPVSHPAYKVTDIIGFAPNNSFNDSFDYKAFQSSATGSTKFEDVLGTGFTQDTGISPDTAIPDGMLPREIGEFRSYLQLPYIYFNKLFKIFQAKAEAITGYQFDLDSEWFNEDNPYWYKLVYMLKNLSTLKNDTYRNSYRSSGNTSCVDPSDTSKQWRYDFSPVSDYLSFNPSQEQNSILAPDHKHFVFPSNSVVNGTMSIHIKFQVATNLGSTQTLKIRGNSVFVLDLYATDGTNNTRIGRICYKDPNTGYYAGESDYVIDVPSKSIPSGAYTWVLSDRDYTFQIPSTNFNGGQMAFYWNLWGYNAEILVDGVSMFVNSNPSTVILGDLTTIASVNDLYLSTTPLVGRSYSRVTLNTLWDNDYNVFEQILNYCKMYRIGVSVDDVTKKIVFKPIHKYFQNYTVNNWTDKIDKTKDYKVTPITFEDKYVLFNYEDSDTKLGDEYRTKYGYDFGEYRLTTDYNFNEETNELFEGINGSMVNTDNSLSWNTLYDHRIIYSMPAEITVYCKDDDRKYVDTFGQYYFHKGLAYWSTEEGLDMRSVGISDDSMLQQGANTFFYVQNQGPITGCTTYPFLDIVYGENMCLFNVPMLNYTYLQNYSGKKSLFKNFWERYLNERYNVQNKKITCYVDLRPNDYINFKWNKLVKLGNQLCVVNKIYDYDVSSNEPTKVDLLTIQNTSAYTTTAYHYDYIRLSASSLAVPYDHYKKITVTASKPWQVKSDDWTDYLDIYPTSGGSGTTTVYIGSIDEEGGYTPTFELIDDDTINRSIYVAVQTSGSSTINVYPWYNAVTAGTAGQTSVISTGGAWNVVAMDGPATASNPPRLIPTSGGNGTTNILINTAAGLTTRGIYDFFVENANGDIQTIRVNVTA